MHLNKRYSPWFFDPFVASAPFLYPLKASEKFTVFWCFQGVEKGSIGNKWVNMEVVIEIVIFQTLIYFSWVITFHCVKTVRIRSFSGPYFPAFWLNTKWYGVSLRIQSKCGKMWTRKTPNTDTFHAVFRLKTYMLYGMFLLLYNKKYLNVSRNLLLRHKFCTFLMNFIPSQI